MPRELDPRVIRFQQIKAIGKVRAVRAVVEAKKEAEIRPIRVAAYLSGYQPISDKVARQVLEAHLRIRNYTVRLNRPKQ